MPDEPMFVVRKRALADGTTRYCVVPNSADRDILVQGPAELELEMVAARLNDMLNEAITEVVFNCANCQGEVV